jgi:hypothetical protein
LTFSIIRPNIRQKSVNLNFSGCINNFLTIKKWVVVNKFLSA